MRARITLSVLFVVYLMSYSAQVTATDNELWTGGTYKLGINKKVRVEFEEQFRFNNNFSSYNNNFTELRLRYKFNKHFAVKGNLRHTIRYKDFNKRRFSIDVYYNWEKKSFPLRFQYRLRLQDSKVFQTGKKTDYLRNKFSLEYNLTKLVDPFVAYEIYYRFNQKNEFRVSRITMGLNWKLNKQIDLSTYYRYQRDINIKRPQAQHIIGLMFSYAMKLKKKEVSSI